MKDGAANTENILINLTKLIEDIKIIGGVETPDFKKIKMIIKDVVASEVSRFKEESLCESRKSSQNSIDPLVENLENLVDKVKNELNSLKEERAELRNAIVNCKTVVRKMQSGNNDILDKLSEEIIKLKIEYGSKLRNIEALSLIHI